VNKNKLLSFRYSNSYILTENNLSHPSTIHDIQPAMTLREWSQSSTT